MTIETKYNRGDKVWFMYSNSPKCRTVRSIIVTSGGRLIGVKDPLIEYDFEEHDSNGQLVEFQLFPTKEELLKSL